MFPFKMQHLEQSNMWGLVTQSCQQQSSSNAMLDPENSSGGGGGNHINGGGGGGGSSYFGALVGRTFEACGIVLRNVMFMVVAGEVRAREDAQAALEAVYRSHVIARLVDACRTYGASLSGRCVTAVVSVLSELVLSSSKFLQQVSL